MKVRNTHCVELDLTAKELAKALGHEGAAVRLAEVRMAGDSVAGLRIHLEYLIASTGPRRTVRTRLERDAEG
jgi:hypothetical protein